MGIWFFSKKEKRAHSLQVFGVGTIDPRGSGAILVPLQHRKVRAEI